MHKRLPLPSFPQWAGRSKPYTMTQPHCTATPPRHPTLGSLDNNRQLRTKLRYLRHQAEIRPLTPERPVPLTPPSSPNTESERLKRKFLELQDVVDFTHKLRRVITDHRSPRVRAWCRATSANGEELLQDAVLDFVGELQTVASGWGVEIGSVGVTCPVCHELYTDKRRVVKLKACPHTMCVGCVDLLAASRVGQHKRCPLCQTPFDATERIIL